MPTHPSYLLITLTTCAIREMGRASKFGLPIKATYYKTYGASSENSLWGWCTYCYIHLPSVVLVRVRTCVRTHGSPTWPAVQCSGGTVAIPNKAQLEKCASFGIRHTRCSCKIKMTLFHFVNCIGAAYAPYFITYRFSGL